MSERLQYVIMSGEVNPMVEFHLGPVKENGALLQEDAMDTRFGTDKLPARDMHISSDGSVVALILDTAITICNMNTGEVVTSIEMPGVQKIQFSPLSTHIESFSRYAPGTDNFKVWNISSGECVFAGAEKHLLNTTWPLMKWTYDETIAGYMTPNNVRVYVDNDFSKYKNVRDEGVAQFSIMKSKKPVSDEHPCKIATFKPENKTRPGKVSIFNYPSDSEMSVAGKSFHKAQEVEFDWSPLGDAVLVKTSTDVDTTGQSYYGESHLYLLHADGSHDCQIIPARAGGFHDFAWSPLGKVFVAISGKSPASSILYNMKGNPIVDFGDAHRNTVRWSPHGRFLCLGGFGNLSGDMDFWDINKKLKIGSTRSDCAVTQEWSPCGRFLMTGTLFPRMRVDNGITFYTYCGELLYKVPIEKASKVFWRPAPEGVYPDRPMSPRKKSPEQAAVAAPAPPKKQVYRPPGATGSLAAMMRQERQVADVPKKIDAGPADPTKKSKAAQRRDRKKKVSAAASGN